MSNTRKALDKLFVSRVRIKILKQFLGNPDIPIHLRGAVRELGEEINAVRRELLRLEEVKILKTDVRGNRKYYLLNREGPFIEELRAIFYKTFGLGGEIIRNEIKLGEINYAMLTGSYLTGYQVGPNPVDLIIIGRPNMQILNDLIADFEKKEEREINYTVFSLNEFELRRRRKDNFIIEMLIAPKIMLIGTADHLVD